MTSQTVTPSIEERLLARRVAAVTRAGEEISARRTLFVVVREPDMQALVCGLARTIAGLPSHDRLAWLANFTKVRLFAGDPTRAAVKPLLACIESNLVGFALVDAEARHPRIADLLLPLSTRSGPNPETPIDLFWGEGDGHWALELDVTGLDWPRYLVHVLHLLAEAAIEDPAFGGRITLLHTSTPPVCDADVAQLRLDLDTSPPTCRAVLRASGKRHEG